MKKITTLSVPVDSYYDQLWVDALSLFPPEALIREIKTLLTLFPVRRSKSDQSWADNTTLIDEFTSYLGVTLGSSIQLIPFVESLSNDEKVYLKSRLKGALSGLEFAKRVENNLEPPTAFLLPLSYKRRVHVILQEGRIPLAWVRSHYYEKN
ncbi:hypothetical protein OTE41_001390 [Salmonella enterica]|nr:hypothetical protein [Salmonella enterica]EKE1131715.1 hypothetical protein [Salmonella enterica]HDY3114943.1 hypothetical protein [Salmonella enterica]